MGHCPVCRARLDEVTVCRRCGCDLTLAEKSRQRARWLIHQALQVFQDGEVETARMLVAEAEKLDASKIVRKAAAFITWYRAQG